MAAAPDQLLHELQVFGATLDANEQAILAHLQSDDDEITDFSCAPDSTLERGASAPKPRQQDGRVPDCACTGPTKWLLVVVRRLAAGQNQQATYRRDHRCEQDANLGIVFDRATFDRSTHGLGMAVVFSMRVVVAM